MSDDPQSRDISDAILTRRFELDDGHVDIHVWAPVAPDDDYARCDYQISGLGLGKQRYSAGVDKLQALGGAFLAINTYLYSSDAWKEGRLTWYGMRNLV